MALNRKTFDELFTFTRASTGTYFDANGVLQTAAIDEPRFDHDPLTGEALDVLFEESRTNICLWSEAFDDATWAKSGGASVSPNTATAPDGAVSADTVVISAGGGAERVSQPVAYVDAGQKLAVSLFVKKISAQEINVRGFHSGGGALDGFFDLDLDTLAVSNVTGAVSGATARALADGWLQVDAIFTANNTGNTSIDLRVGGSIGTPAAGDFYLWGVQLEDTAGERSSYIPTAGSAVTRSKDVCTVEDAEWLQNKTGTIYAVGSMATRDGVFPRLAELTDGTSSNTVNVGVNSGVLGTYGAVSFEGAEQITFSATPYVSQSELRVAISYADDDFRQAINGALANTDTACTMPLLNRLVLAESGRSTVSYLKEFRYYPYPMTTAELEALTA